MTVWFCIPPVNYLDMMKSWRYHMVIAPHLLHSNEYAFFYKNTPHLHIMLDNGLWEGEVIDGAKLLALAIMIGAKEIIAPDDKSKKKTIQKTTKFIDYLGEDRYDYYIHGAIHGETLEEQTECLEALLELDIDIVDMPKMLGHINRAALIHKVLEKKAPPKIHFLGYYKEEWDMLLNSTTVRSFDTSVPFKPNYHKPFQLDLPYTLKNRMIIKYRTAKWKRMFNGR